MDIIDGTPLLDLKPHVPEIESEGPYALGWLSDAVQKLAAARSDSRF